ncbi:MAG: M48 family metalloprotease [Betaproteobacteria bacterium]
MTPPRPTSKLRWRAGLAALLVALHSSLAPAQTGGAAQALPALGDGVDLSIASERRLGDRIARSIYRDPDWLDDAVLGDYLQAVWQPLVKAARLRGDLSADLQERFAWELFLVRDRSVNAFALPGGYLGVHTGLIATVSSSDELAAVMGHELSHVTQRHIARMFTQQQNQAPWLVAALILGVLAAGRSTNAANAALVGGQAVAMQGQLNFSRDMEREADRVGFGVMTEAGFGAEGASAMFEKLQQANRFNDNGSFPYLRSHPLTTERIAEARTRSQGVSGQSASAARSLSLPSAAWHAMMAGRARILSETGPDALLAQLQQARQLAANASREQSLSALYAGALAAARLREAAEARQLVARVMSLAAGGPQIGQAAKLLAIEVETMLGDALRGAALVSWSATPSRAELFTQSRVLMQAGRADEVSDRLRSWVSLQAHDSTAWGLLAQSLQQQGLVLQAVRADAEGRAAQFDFQGAVDRLKAAQDLLRQSNTGMAGANLHIEASIIDTRARQFQTQLREQALQERNSR